MPEQGDVRVIKATHTSLFFTYALSAFAVLVLLGASRIAAHSLPDYVMIPLSISFGLALISGNPKCVKISPSSIEVLFVTGRHKTIDIQNLTSVILMRRPQAGLVLQLRTAVGGMEFKSTSLSKERLEEIRDILVGMGVKG